MGVGMQDKKFSYQNRTQKAFTLVELVITIALFALVAGLVISYITFMNRFTDQNEEISDRVEQASDVRRQIDLWFSYFDQTAYTVTLPEDGSALAVAEGGGQSYSLTLSVTQPEDGGARTAVLSAQFPARSGYNDSAVQEDGTVTESDAARLSCNAIGAVLLWNGENWSFDSEGEREDNALRFLIDCRVTQCTYACEIRYV